MANVSQPKDSTVAHSFFTTVLVVLSWYTANIVLLLLNKYLLTSINFRQPVFLTLCHMLACVGMGLAISASGHLPIKPIKSKAQFVKVFVLSCIFCATIVLGNVSLRYLPVSFTQAIGATTPFFTAVLAFMMQGTRESLITYMTLFPIMGGIAIASGGEPLFHAVGFTFAVMATAGRAMKSVVQGIIMTDPAEKLDPMSLLLHMSVISVGLLIPLTFFLEPDAFAKASLLSLAKPMFLWWLLGNSILAYFVNLTNFLVTKFTSPLTLQVLGNAKGVIAAVISVMVFVNPVTASGVLGYALTTIGVFLYSETKRHSKAPSSHNNSNINGAASTNTVTSSSLSGDASVIVSMAGHRDHLHSSATPSRTPRVREKSPGNLPHSKDLGNNDGRGIGHFFRSQERPEGGGLMV